MKTVAVINNNTNTTISIPEDSRVIQYKSALFPEIPVLPEPGKAVAAAIKNPIGCPPMKDLIKPGYKIAIAFDDPIKCSKVLQTMIPVVLEELNAVGIKDKDVILISANGTHCKWRPNELKRHLGENLYKRFRPSDWIEGQIINHDCTSGNSYIGMTELGDEVEHNSILFDSDFVIYIGTIYPFALGGYPGQGVSIGLGSMRALNSLHSYDVYKTPAALHGDYDPAKNIYRKHKLEVHKTIEKALQKRIFYVDALLGGNEEVIDVYAGYVPELEKVEYAVADKYFKIDVNQADIVITGLPYILDYDTSDNPACSANFAARALRGWRNKSLLKKNGVLIVLGRCLGNFSSRRPADPLAYNIYRNYFDAKQFYEHVDSFCNNSDFLFKYKFEYAYSPIHSIFMMANIDTLQKVSMHTTFVGDIHPGTIREIGAVPLRNFDEAFSYAIDIVGNSPEIIVLPSYFQDPKPIFNVL